MNKKIKAIIFDMDEVLIDVNDCHYDALNKALIGNATALGIEYVLKAC